jgi:16S rRNA (guanine527-N7)-methyltransferase
MTNDERAKLPEMTELWQQTLNWQPDEHQQQLFERLYVGILAGNRQLNLTRIVAPVEFWEKHLWDSLRGVAPLLAATTPSQRAIDIGTGAGFPGLPVAIALPQLTVTLVDSTRKKINFLDQFIPELGIDNATTVIGRAEAIAKQPSHRRAYDLALVRAVGSALVCAQYALPLLKPGGLAILYRGRWTEEEQEAFPPALAQLGGTLESIEAFVTPISDSIRHCLYIRRS